MDLEAFRWLLSEEGRSLLARTTEVYDGQPAHALEAAAVLRREAAPDHVAAAMTQVIHLVAGRCGIGEVPSDRWDARALYRPHPEPGQPVLARLPGPDELETAQRFIAEHSWEGFIQALLGTNEFAYLD